MRKWALVTIGLYALLVVVLTGPLLWLAFIDDSSGDALIYLYALWPYWAVVAVLVLAQALMLLVPVRAAKDLQIKRRHFLVPVVAAGFMMGILVALGMLSLLVAFVADDVDEWQMYQALGAGVFFWVLWALLFRAFSYTTPEPRAWMRRVTRKLLAGSIVELLVAVASHIVVRRRGDCSAPVFTFWGIAAGLAVMFISFGPGVFYLFADRKKRMMSRRRRQEMEEAP